MKFNCEGLTVEERVCKSQYVTAAAERGGGWLKSQNIFCPLVCEVLVLQYLLFFLLSPRSSVLCKTGQIHPWPKSVELNEVTFGTLKILDKCSACSLRLSNPQSKNYFLVRFFFLEEKCVIS